MLNSFFDCNCEKYQPGLATLSSTKTLHTYRVILVFTDWVNSKTRNLLCPTIFHFLYTVQDAVHGCPKGLADYNLNSIPYSLAALCIIIPRLWSWRKASRGFISSIRDRSEWEQTLHERKPSSSCWLPSPGSHIFVRTTAVSARPGAYLVTLLLAGTYL